MVRRRFPIIWLIAALTGLSGCGSGRPPDGSPPSSPAPGGEVKEFHLSAAVSDWQLNGGSAIQAWAFNGQVPGPPLVVRAGDLVKVDFTNNLSQPTSVHWHGVAVPNAMDGTPEVTQKAIPPGGTFHYEFVAPPTPGTYWYHSHFDEMTQVRSGLYGPLIIKPREQAPAKEATVMLSDYGTQPGASPTPVAASASPAAGMGGMGGMGGMPGMSGTPAGMMGAPQQPSDEATAFLMNGKQYPATPELDVRSGERVRLRLINASASADHFIRLDGQRFTVVATDGHELPQPVSGVQLLRLGPAERVDIEFTADRPGVWALHCVIPEHLQRGMAMTIRVDGASGQPQIDQGDPRQLRLWAPDEPASQAQPVRADRTVDLQISGNMMGSSLWTLNGQTYPKVTPIEIKRGQHVLLRMTNMSMEPHPMHLHGMPFQVLKVDGHPVAAATKDTVELGPMGSAEVLVKADNPGTWLFHCHNLEHMMNGLATLIRVQ